MDHCGAMAGTAATGTQQKDAEMNTLTRKITAAVAGAAATAGIVTGIFFAAPAQAQVASAATMSCTTAASPGRVGLSSSNPLTRAAQVAAIENLGTARGSAAVSCLGH